MAEERLPGGSNSGAVLVDGTVRRATGETTPAVHALLRHLAAVGFDGAPRVLGIDEQGREILTHLPGGTVGDSRPWPAWARSDAALIDAGRWLRRYHDAVASFRPPPGAHWFGGQGELRPGEIIGHNDAGPYNAVWGDDGIVGFIDWDLARPMPPVRDLAFVAISWVPLLPGVRVAADGFGPDLDRAARLDLLTDAYGWRGGRRALLAAVVRRAEEHASGLREAAAGGYGPAAVLVAAGVADGFDAVHEVVAGLG